MNFVSTSVSLIISWICHFETFHIFWMKLSFSQKAKLWFLLWFLTESNSTEMSVVSSFRGTVSFPKIVVLCFWFCTPFPKQCGNMMPLWRWRRFKGIFRRDARNCRPKANRFWRSCPIPSKSPRGIRSRTHTQWLWTCSLGLWWESRICKHWNFWLPKNLWTFTSTERQNGQCFHYFHDCEKNHSFSKSHCLREKFQNENLHDCFSKFNYSQIKLNYSFTWNSVNYSNYLNYWHWSSFY